VASYLDESYFEVRPKILKVSRGDAGELLGYEAFAVKDTPCSTD